MLLKNTETDSLIINREIAGLYPSSLKNKIARVICVSAVVAEPLYSAFMWQALVDASKEAIKVFGIHVTSQIENYIKYIAIPLHLSI